MAQAIAARLYGDDYQARWLWINACRLFGDRTKVTRIAFEQNNVKSFDDITVFYGDGMHDEEGYKLLADYYQVKFHVTAAGAIGWQGMMDPAFINASSVSLLQRLRNAQRRYVPHGRGGRFILYTPWSVHPDDLLASIQSETDGRIVWAKLADGGPRSEVGKVRTAWREHLAIRTDEELSTILCPLRLLRGRTMQELRDTLNDRLQLAGLMPVEEGALTHPYDDLTRKLLQTRRTTFTRSDIEQICKQEHLWRGHTIAEYGAHRVGIRSFLRWAEQLEDETDEMLCLLSCFDGRKPLSPDLWHTTVFPRLETFLSQAMRGRQSYHLHLHAHASIAFAAGYCLDTKAGVDVVPVQSTPSGRHVWRPTAHPNLESYPTWSFAQELISNGGQDVALVLGVTYPIVHDVRYYVAASLPHIGRLISCVVPPGPSNESIIDGTHAKLLAQQISTYLKSERTIGERRGVLHIFAAAPNALLFFLGQLARSFGRCMLYEYDFESGAPEAYQPSLTFPPFAQEKQEVANTII